ncbi:MAG: hypothetical protein DCF31_08460 [Alphaproteobacteria bacterium]|nr:MAG: hypothetical protein DCF31_08460 [Alphaproteobacteria bacterium]
MAVPPAAMAAARSLLARQPLSPLPFQVAARDAAARGDIVTATRLFEQELLRNPRDVGVRLWLADRYLRSARFSEAVEQLDAAMRIRPKMRRQLVAVLVPLIGAPTGREAVAAALVRGAAWQGDFLDEAARNDAVAPAFYELLFGLGGASGFRLSDAQLSRIVTMALSRGDYRSAWTLYSRFAPRSNTDPANRVFDGNFRGAAGPPPFNWQFFSTPSGFARVEPTDMQGRLTVHTFGSEPATLAAQTMLLPPGLYQLSSAGVPDDGGDASSLSWRLICDRTRRELGRFPVAGSAAAGAPGGIAVMVPALCPVATLRLIYAPPLRPVLENATLTSVALELVEALAP